MAYIRRSGGQLALLLLSLLGIGISIYLTFVHYDSEGVPLLCSASGVINCERVLSSSYSVVPGTTIPVSMAGILWFVVSLALALLAWLVWPQRRSLLLAEMAWTSIGMLTVFYLVYTEIVHIRAICAWCTCVHFITLVMFLLTLVLLQLPAQEDEEEEEEETADSRPAITTKRR